MDIEIGKTYLTRDGSLRVRIMGETEIQGTYRMVGEDDRGRLTWRSHKGRFTRHPHHLDLVKEA